MAIIETEGEFSTSNASIALSKSTAGTRFSIDGKIGVAIVADDSAGGTSHFSIYGDFAKRAVCTDNYTLIS